MKQHMAEKDWVELSKEQKVKLGEWCSNHVAMVFSGTKIGSGYLLSIGQMIEFLEPYLSDIATSHGVANDEVKGWRIFILQGKTHRGDELCDVLWEAVREVLNAK